MKFLQQINTLVESQEDETQEKATQKIEDLWQEIKSGARTYIASTKFDVRYDEGSKEYHIFKVENNRRTKYAVMKKSEFNDTFTPVNATMKPDAEGFTTYRLSDAIEAAPYNGETTYVDINGKDVKINRGDFVTRTLANKEELFAVETKSFFTKTFVKA